MHTTSIKVYIHQYCILYSHSIVSNYITNSKRRQSSEVSTLLEGFSVTTNTPPPPNMTRSVSHPAQQTHMIKVKDANVVSRRPKSNDPNINNNNTNEYLIISTNSKSDKQAGATVSPNTFSNSSKQQQQQQTSSSSFDQSLSSSSSGLKGQAAPNITITQGMIVSLPPSILENTAAILQSNNTQQQNMYTVGKPVVTNNTSPNPNRTVQQVSTPSTPPVLKQVSILFSLLVCISTNMRRHLKHGFCILVL